MICKYCHSELEEGVTRCPVCGKDNAAAESSEPECPDEALNSVPDDAQLNDSDQSEIEEMAEMEDLQGEKPETTEELEEQTPDTPKKTISSSKLAVIYIVILAVLAVLVGFILHGMRDDSAPGGKPDAVVGTVPANGSDNDVTCKGTYTVSDKKAISKANKVVATAGHGELTNADLQIYYWVEVFTFLKNNNDPSLLDMRQPLDTQTCPISEEGWTWQQYFLDRALKNWHIYYTFGQEAKTINFEYEEDILKHLDELVSSLEDVAKQNNLGSADDLVKHNMGPASSIEAYESYYDSYYKGYAFYSHIRQELQENELTDDAIREYFDENAEKYKEIGVEDDGSALIDVRHILIKVEKGAAEADRAEAEKKAQEILDEWLSGDKTEQSFGELAGKYSEDPGSQSSGGLYENVYKGQMVPEFDSWCFDENRKIGDYGIVKTDFGYHIMYYSDRVPVWYVYAKDDLLWDKVDQKIEELQDNHPVKIDYSKIAIGLAEAAG